MTFYPHSVDNTHAGFVVYPPPASPSNLERKNWALIYAKKANFIQNHENILKIISEDFELHGTIADEPEEIVTIGTSIKIHNHGWLNTNDYIHLMQSSKIMIGLGFPYEGQS